MPSPPPYIAKICTAKEFLGTGVLVSPTLVLTCEHVVRQIGPRTILLVSIDGNESKAKLKNGAKDRDRDLALIELPDAVAAAPPAWSDQVARGHQCNALGFPGGEYEPVPATVRDAQSRRIDLEQSLVDGSSGGALVRLVHDGGHCVGLLRRGGDGVVSNAIGARIVAEFLSQHGVVLPAEPPPSPRSKLPNTDAYFEALRRETREIDLDALKVPRETGNPPRIDALYIPLKTSRAQDIASKGPVGESAPAALESALEDRRLLIEGEAGSGKTTFLRRIAWALCRKDKEEKLRLPFRGFPMFIRISKLDRHIHQTLQARQPGDPIQPDDVRWIAHYLASQNPGLSESFFQEKLQSSENVLLLDGLDEAADSLRRADIAHLVRQASERGCRYVVSTRPHAAEGTAALPGFTLCRVEPLDEPAIGEFLRIWCAWLGKDEAYLNGLRHDVSATPWKIRSNPFMLTALAVVYLQNKRLPHERADLYEAIIQWLSQQAEERWRDHGGHRQDDILRWTGMLALAMQEWKGGQTLLISVREAAEAIREELPYQKAKEFIEEAHVISGILTLRGEDQIAFWHKAFQEYLAARTLTGLLDGERSAKALRLLYSPEGREVLPLAAGRMVKAERNRLDLLFEKLIGDAAARSKPALQAHAAGVIGSMLGDLKRTSYKLRPPVEARWEELLANAKAIFDPQRAAKIPLRTRIAAADALAAAGDPRLHMPWEQEYWAEIPAGSFLMGSPPDDKEADSDEKPGRVKLPRFHIGRFPVTVWEYGRYLEAVGAAPPDDWDRQAEHASRPVVSVTWHQAMAYCQWASRQWKVTLPTEEQWEYAARGTEGRRYPWGDEAPTPERANYDQTGIGEPTPVGLFPLGNIKGREIADMAGNVWEWTTSNLTKGPKVVRGASCFFSAGYLRAACRGWFGPEGSIGLIGFRCVRE